MIEHSMDLSQIILLAIILVVGVLLVVIGIQVIGLLKEARETLRKFDLMIEDLGFMTRSLTRSGTALGNMLTSMQSGMQLVGLVTKVLAPKDKKN